MHVYECMETYSDMAYKVNGDRALRIKASNSINNNTVWVWLICVCLHNLVMVIYNIMVH